MPSRKKEELGRPARSTRQSTRQTRSSNHAVPNIYREMLAEAATSEVDDFAASPRPHKRRRVSEPESVDALDISLDIQPPNLSSPLAVETRQQQIVFDDFEGSDESDIEFEDVDLDQTKTPLSENEQTEPLKLDFTKASETTPKRNVNRRRPITKAERDLRLDVHKWHYMSLLIHQLTRNMWCESGQVHAILKPLVPRKTIKLLHIDESQPLFQQNSSYIKGLEEICALWRREWQTIFCGLRRAYWKESVDAQEEYDDAEDPVDFDDFKLAAQERRGSRDLGAQLFCALLRSVAVEARLVFSFQVLPYSGEAKPEVTEQSVKSPYIKAPAQSYSKASDKQSKKKITDSAFPVFWTEVWNSATTTWVPVDPLVRNTINKPKTQFEPPASDTLNSMTYVIAFEDDNTARDVTRRYTQWFNAKTRKSRVENTKGGDDWYRSVMRIFERKYKLPRDLVEDDQLLQRAAAEGMPKSIQDFKNHPVYVLERHLRRNEVIHPKREVGKVSAGAKNTKLEIVYRRQDVHACRTADAWYRRGMDVRVGEQPLKRAMPKNNRSTRALSEDDGEDGEQEGVALYAAYQTQVYEPPPVIDGRIPKNVYGNLDVYVPSMIPPGAVHIMHPLASRAAKVLGIDYADAVTGFDFKGRQGTAVINGAVISGVYTAAIVASIEGLEFQGTQEVQQERSRIIQSIWKRMLTALRIRQKLEEDYGEKVRQEDEEEDDHDSTYEDTTVEEDGGGFMLEADETREKAEEQTANLQNLKEKAPYVLPDEVTHIPIKIAKSPHKLPNQDVFHATQAKLVTSNNGDEPGGFMPEDEAASSTSHVSLKPAAEDQDQQGGGFLPDDTVDSTTPTQTSIPHRTSYDDLFDDDTPTAPQSTKANSQPPESGGGGFIPDDDDNPPDDIPPTTPNNNETSDVANDTDTSMLSHDPAEDDDEPEWLEEALD